MKLEDVVKAFSVRYKIEYVKRKEGGIIIKSINGVKYKGKSGNVYFRKLANATLSNAQKEAIRAGSSKKKAIAEAKEKGLPKPRKARKKKPLKLGKQLSKRLRKTRKAFKELDENQKRIVGTPTRKKILQSLKREGRKATTQKLKEAERYAKGKIYSAQLDFMITRIEETGEMRGLDVSELVDFLTSHKNSFYEERFIAFKEELYKWESDMISYETFLETTKQIFRTSISKLRNR